MYTKCPRSSSSPHPTVRPDRSLTSRPFRFPPSAIYERLIGPARKVSPYLPLSLFLQLPASGGPLVPCALTTENRRLTTPSATQHPKVLAQVTSRPPLVKKCPANDLQPRDATKSVRNTREDCFTCCTSRSTGFQPVHSNESPLVVAATDSELEIPKTDDQLLKLLKLEIRQPVDQQAMAIDAPILEKRKAVDQPARPCGSHTPCAG
jgi:hypothetical protein